jgi:lysylphosphatidylglycerol synthetase-like protein (DUF2156 family)
MRRELVRAFGSDPISYSTLQPGLSHFETSFGSISYQRALGFDLTLGPPLCAPADRAELITRFLRDRRWPIFFYVQEDLARLALQLAGPRHQACGIGVDKLLSVSAWAQPDPRVASAMKKAKKRGLVLREVQMSQLSATDAGRIREITARYLQRSAVSAEMHFLNRPLTFDDDGMARTFVLEEGADGEPFGYAALDPYFEGGRPAGYLLNQLRFEPTPLWGVYFSAVSILAEKLRSEGVGELSLGFAPLASADTSSFSPKLGAQVRWMERKFAAVPYIARLREMKDAFQGRTPQRYFVTPSRWVASTIVAFLRACRVPLWPIVRSKLPWRPS